MQKHADRNGDSDGHWEWSLVSSRLHVSAAVGGTGRTEEREVGTTPDPWLT